LQKNPVFLETRWEKPCNIKGLQIGNFSKLDFFFSLSPAMCRAFLYCARSGPDWSAGGTSAFRAASLPDQAHAAANLSNLINARRASAGSAASAVDEKHRGFKRQCRQPMH
jgi:hypothetical protein